jgi:hypothetical protein
MRTTGFLAFLCAFALTLSTLAFAKAKNQGSFDLAQVASFGSVQLPPGHYKAEWTGTNGTVDVSLIHNGKTVATTRAELKELARPAANSAVTLRTTPSHNERIEEIQFNNRKEALFLSARAS